MSLQRPVYTPATVHLGEEESRVVSLEVSLPHYFLSPSCVRRNAREREREKRLTRADLEEDFGVALDLFILCAHSLHHELAGVAVCVGGPELGDGHVGGVTARVPADAHSAFEGLVDGGVVLGVLEEDVYGTEPAALQVEAEGWLAPRLHVAVDDHRLSLQPLHERNIAAKN